MAAVDALVVGNHKEEVDRLNCALLFLLQMETIVLRVGPYYTHVEGPAVDALVVGHRANEVDRLLGKPQRHGRRHHNGIAPEKFSQLLVSAEVPAVKPGQH